MATITKANKQLKLIGNHIREIRTTKKLVLKDVASDMQLTPQAYGNIENGKTDISYTQAYKLSNILNEPIVNILKLGDSNINNFTHCNNTFLNSTQNNTNIPKEIMDKFLELFALIKK